MLPATLGLGQKGYERDLTISVVAYRSDPEELARVVRCCQSARLALQVAVVDNSPTRDLESLCHDLGVEYLYTGRNVGFGSAHNIALRSTATSKYHLVLNPDVQFEGNVLEELTALLDANASVGLVMPRVLYPDGSTQHLCKRLPSPLDILIRRLSYGSIEHAFQRRIAAFELRNQDMNRALSVPYLSGCFMMLRKQALWEVGGFDEKFFMYFEDLDLTRRIQQRYATVYYPRATVIHRHEKGSYKSARLLYCGIESAVRYFNKWGWLLDRERDEINNAIGPVELDAPRIPEQNGSAAMTKQESLGRRDLGVGYIDRAWRCSDRLEPLEGTDGNCAIESPCPGKVRLPRGERRLIY